MEIANGLGLLAYRAGPPVQFERDTYVNDVEILEGMTREEVVAMLKRNSTGFAR